MRKNKQKYLCIALGICIIIGLFLIWKYITKNKKEGFDNTDNYLDGIGVIYWINLDRSTDRRKRMEKLLMDSSFDGIPTERITAYDGKTNAKGIFDKIMLKKKIQTNTEYGCLLSHLETIRKFNNSKYNVALILEDDVSLDFKLFWKESIQNIINNAPPDWDIILLCYNTTYQFKPNEKYIKAYETVFSTVAYIINKSGSNKLTTSYSEVTKKYNIIDDGAADQYLYKLTNAYCYKYSMLTYTGLDSTIHSSHLQGHLKSKQQILEMFRNELSPFTNIHIYYINLVIRHDRNTQILNEFKRMNISLNKITRIEAIHDKQNGYIGCVKSHIIALKKFIESNNEACIIFEDDVEFIQPIETVYTLLNDFFNSNIKYDVCMLASNTFENKDTEYPFLKKVINSQAASAMLIHRNFAKTLLTNYEDGLRLLEKTGDKKYIIDQYFKKIMPTNDWYEIYPKMCKQRESYSDILNTNVNYNV